MPNTPSAARPSKGVQWILTITTILYIGCSPALLLMVPFSAMIPDFTWMTMFIMSWLPLSVPISVYFMWAKYRQGESRKALFFAGLPIYVFLALSLIL